jgi:hypothetical protein
MPLVAAASLAGLILLATGWGSAVASQISSVFVTNTTANPVPVQAAGTLPTHEQGTASVNVTNTSVPVHEQGTALVRSADTEISLTKLIGNEQGNACSGPIFTIPAGQELVLEYIAAGNGFGPANGSQASNVVGDLFGGTDITFLPLVFVSQGNHAFRASEAVHYVISSGVLQFAGGEDGNTTCGFEVSIGGYLRPH